jgi:hypothetical protein
MPDTKSDHLTKAEACRRLADLTDDSERKAMWMSAADGRTHANKDGGRKWAANRGATSVRFNYVSSVASKGHGKLRRKLARGRDSRERKKHCEVRIRRPPRAMPISTSRM